MQPRRRALRAAGALIFSLLTILAASDRAAADQWLSNTSFEQGADGWIVIAGSVGTCPGRSGSGAMGLPAPAATPSRVSQLVSGPLAAGSYTFAGYSRLLTSQTLTAEAKVQWTINGAVSTKSAPLSPTEAFGAFLVVFEIAQTAESIRVEVIVTGDASATLCLDDLTLEGPPPPLVVPTSTATTTASPAPGSATATSVAASPSSTPSSTATATASPTPSGPSFIFVNGGFEAGIKGWQKFGGELTATASLRASGGAAGSFVSNTDSTKWVYQAVVIDPNLAYQFQGYVMTAAGVAEAYLRISWYASTDGSGSALSSDDSTARLGANNGAFQLLTTGFRNPPSGTRSARVRVMLAPASAATAVIHLDDFSLTTGVASAPTPSPSAASNQPAAGSTAEPGSAATGTNARASAASTMATPPPQVTSSSSSATLATRRTPTAGAPETSTGGGGNGSPSWLYFALPVTVLGLAGSLLYTKWRNGRAQRL